MVVHLRIKGYSVNRKRVQRLMRVLGLAGIAPGPNTSRPHPQHKIYPYLLRGVDVTRPNQVWSTDITYIRLTRGFVYLAAVIDWYSRKVLAWRLSNTLESEFCVDCLEQSIRSYGTPEIFNTDQGCQFTSDAFTGVLKLHGIAISMDGRGRALDKSADEIPVSRFNAEGLAGWEPKSFKGTTEYRLVKEEGRTVVKAVSHNSASGLIRKIRFQPSKHRYLRWDWKISHTIKGGDEKSKSGDDYTLALPANKITIGSI